MVVDQKILKEYLFKEVDLIQEVIKRMAFNSFIIKGWALTLVVATILIKGDVSNIWISYIPLFVFWSLDSYFLWQERMYRKLYEWVVANRLNTDEYLFNMNAYRFKNEVQSQFRIMGSQTMIWFYGSIAFLVFLYKLINGVW